MLDVTSEQDVWLHLSEAWITAELNLAAGAVVTAEIEALLSEAEALLATCPCADDDLDLDLDVALSLLAAIEVFNAGHLSIDVCVDDDADLALCLHGAAYWETHHRYVAAVLAWPEVDGHPSEDLPICGETWLDVLLTTSVSADAMAQLKEQYVVAQLNLAAGVEATAGIADALRTCEALFELDCTTSLLGVDLDAVAGLLVELEAYNAGAIALDVCLTD